MVCIKSLNCDTLNYRIVINLLLTWIFFYLAAWIWNWSILFNKLWKLFFLEYTPMWLIILSTFWPLNLTYSFSGVFIAPIKHIPTCKLSYCFCVCVYCIMHHKVVPLLGTNLILKLFYWTALTDQCCYTHYFVNIGIYSVLKLGEPVACVCLYFKCFVYVNKTFFKTCILIRVYVCLCVYVCVCVSIHEYLRTYIHTYIQKHKLTYILSDVYTYIYMYIRIYIYAHIFVVIYIHTYKCKELVQQSHFIWFWNLCKYRVVIMIWIAYI